ncbi:hypothetical protein HYH85_17445 [Clostridium botulinum]|uniref:hypothetical protein n=1 Tax=Clostridium botulinum TaxID=1491 RepID=UPI001C9B7005|nr:hypothetical protein [Clostridium botulinum]MBY6798002.1 hypothetical protein [Clostridium botulinum]MBY6866988.1 hypothetical protein [Clostridium botulinum]
MQMERMMDMYSDNNELIKKHSKFQNKLSFINLIITTFICIAPSIWLVIRIVDNETDKLLVTTLLAIPTLIYMTYIWCAYYYKRKLSNLEEEIGKLRN